jgi:hypothetical protein
MLMPLSTHAIATNSPRSGNSRVFIGDAWEFCRIYAKSTTAAVQHKKYYRYIQCDLFDANVVTPSSQGDTNNNGFLADPHNVANLAAIVDPACGMAVIHLHSGPRLAEYLTLLRQAFVSVVVLRAGSSFVVVAAHVSLCSDSDGDFYSVDGREKMAQRLANFGERHGYHPQISQGAKYSLFVLYQCPP